MARGQRWICCTQHPHQHQSPCQPLGTCRSGGLGCSTPCRTFTHSIWHLQPYPTLPLTCQMYTPKICLNAQHLAFTTLPNSSSNMSDVHAQNMSQHSIWHWQPYPTHPLTCHMFTSKMCLNTQHLALTALPNYSSNISDVHTQNVSQHAASGLYSPTQLFL